MTFVTFIHTIPQVSSAEYISNEGWIFSEGRLGELVKISQKVSYLNEDIEFANRVGDGDQAPSMSNAKQSDRHVVDLYM